MRMFFVCLCSLYSLYSFAQPTRWITGDSLDVSTNHAYGILLAGGGGDNDDAMSWLLDKSDGGDVVVIRTSGSDGYNNYLFTDIGGVNSVETILIQDSADAFDPYVENQIRNAEVLFIAGGDQYTYYTLWKDSPIQQAINYLISTKKAAVGGTSAGMAILGGRYYAPENLGVISSEALSNPYHPNMDIIGIDDFIQVPELQSIITDTHFDDRDRAGRTATFLARLVKDQGSSTAKFIACNEYTAVAIDTGIHATIFGDAPNYEDYAYFAQVSCPTTTTVIPELCEPNQPLTWVLDSNAITVFKAGGTIDGTSTFNISSWEEGSNGEWQQWIIDNGSLIELSSDAFPCEEETPNAIEHISKDYPRVGPNPATESITVYNLENQDSYFELIDLTGKMIKAGYLNDAIIDLGSIDKGIYLLKIEGFNPQRIVKQ